MTTTDINATVLVRGRSLVDAAVFRIGNDIVGGRYPQGASLPNESDWCTQLGISRSVLREALRVLVSKNLIVVRARTGGRVRPSTDWNVLDPDVLTWMSEGADKTLFTAELFELRRIVEPAVAALAALRVTAEQLDTLYQCCDAMERAHEDSSSFILPDDLFHRTLLDSVGNSLFRGLAQAINMAVNITLQLSLHGPRGLQHSVSLHRNVVDAIANGDSVAAEAAMRHLIDESATDAADALGLHRSNVVAAR